MNKPQKLTPFKHFCLSIGVIPSAYTDAMTYYELLEWLCKYLQENVIPTVNNNSEVVTELQDYVAHYFDNLDVQQEVNTKLDEMASDGTLTNLIKAYVDPIYEAFEQEIDTTLENYSDTITDFTTDINQTVNNQNQQIETLENMVTTLSSGSPAGAYETVSDLETADPDHDKIYVVTEDGKWYYYDTSTTEWTAGGDYQTPLPLNSVLYEIGSNLIDETTLTSQKMVNWDGNLTASALYNASDFIEIENNTTYTTYTRIRTYALYDSEKTFISGSYVSTEVSANGTIAISNSSAKYIRFSLYAADSLYMFVKGNSLITKYVPYQKIIENDINASSNIINQIDKEEDKNKIRYSTTINLINPYEIQLGKFTSYSSIVDNASYKITGYIPVQYNQTYTTNIRVRAYRFFDANKVMIQDSGSGDEITAGSTITVTNNKAEYVVLSLYIHDENYMLYEGTESQDYVPFKKVLEDSAGLSDTMKNEISKNVLYGKKLVTCGDSFTAYTNATFDSGIYYGKDKTWPYLIGLRNNMTVVNLAVSGSTMSITDYTENNFADGMFNDIPNDADYIIIKYGINDNNANVPIGTITSEDTSTFYGAWNYVMSEIINDHPLAKIGIIVTNGLANHNDQPNNSYYADAIINIAKKYGIPTLNEWNDDNVPLLNRTGRINVASTIKEIRNTTFRVSSDNTHENYLAHEYESTMIEDFLRRL